MTAVAFSAAVLALLLTPGPTNTLIVLAGARRGFAGALRLMPAEVLGYMTAVLPVAYLGTLARWPAFDIALKLAAASWVLVLAVRLWSMPGRNGTQDKVSASQVYLTTVMNPKSLVFGLVLLPQPGTAEFTARLGLLALLVLGSACAWAFAGSLLEGGGSRPGRIRIVQKLASVWLALLSGTLIAGVLQA